MCIWQRGIGRKKNRGILISFIFIYGPQGSQHAWKPSGEEEYYTEGLLEVDRNSKPRSSLSFLDTQEEKKSSYFHSIPQREQQSASVQN